MNSQNINPSELNRRDFLGGSFSSMMLLMGGVAINRGQSQPAASAERYAGPPVNLAVIGCGPWGREVLTTLSRFSRANVMAICDTFPAFLRRGGEAAPKAEKIADYRQILENKSVHGVIVATPTHQHKQIVLEALEAGKHVYCEAPLAHTLDEARAIARAARDSKKCYFQAGLQQRADPELIDVLNFVRAGAAGTPVAARSQWHKKNSWRRASANPERERELNWRLRNESSIGLPGEVGIHALDSAAWFVNRRPKSVAGFGSTILWNDGREVPDTTQIIVEYQGGARLTFDATLANSFDSEYDLFYGTDATVMIRDRRGWMFKEVDSPLLGWEVYARKESFFKEVGIVLAANATKLAAQGDNPVIDTQINSQTSLFYALEAFIRNTDLARTGVDDFTASFGADDLDAMSEYLKDILKDRAPAADYKTGFEATAVAIAAHESVRTGKRIELTDEWFNLG